MTLLPSHGTLAKIFVSFVEGSLVGRTVLYRLESLLLFATTISGARLSGGFADSLRSSAPVKMTCEMGLEIQNAHEVFFNGL